MRPDAGMSHTLYRAVPERPVGVDGDIDAIDLGKETRMAKPRYRNLLLRRYRQMAKMATRLARREKRGDQHLIEKLHVAFAPAFGGQQADAVGVGRLPSHREAPS